MKAIWYEGLGPAREVLQQGEMDSPEPGPGEVRVKLHASGVNPADVKRRGLGTYGMDYPRIIPNSDGAGIIDAAGDEVSDIEVGQRVWLFNGQRQGRAFGTAAEYITLDAWLVAPLPDTLGFDEGACLGIPCMTGHHNVFSDGPVTGKTVLVTGGAGAVGHYAIQWARWGGATVIATVSSDAKAAHAVAGGAHHTVNYRDDDPAQQIFDLTGGEGVDRIVEVDLAANLGLTAKALKSGGTVSVYASTGDPENLMLRMALRNARLRFMVLHSVPRAAIDAARTDIVTWLADGNGLHTVAGTFPLMQCAEAHEYVESGAKMGTVIVRPAD
ncbi:MAG: NADPH:quinone reductase [Rhodospirillaceae bacterium]|jgi:NADPH2:quinone reductase|nr:NADPH:quinone reductase [Rhodospirillaceae bacterium]MBT3930330.1 NADPH:quinone reductase [Rhodospirillaceae bacterium]MBT4772182.1 NADPH:quinone reductase [Rhodospirillaceae bacterium]MBT5359469.1 NADPH:quinone reductase [Rhodospirillaceae bacterium]MBT5768338.1 NADPH:quinone reductase [Rhodospirillaceae bacterium]